VLETHDGDAAENGRGRAGQVAGAREPASTRTSGAVGYSPTAAALHQRAAYDGDSLVRLAVFHRWPTIAPTLMGVALVTAIAVFDWASGPEVSGSLLYVLAVLAVTWCGRFRDAVFVSLLAAAESLAGHVAVAGWAAPAALAWNSATRLAVLIGVSALLSRLRAALVRERHLAAIDPLTGALNRRAFQMTAERERLRAARTGTATSVLYLDLDDFKAVNDRLGHRVGDRLLTDFAEVIASTVRGTDVFGRIGGDEFVVLLPDTDVKEALTVAGRLRSATCEPCETAEVTASVGIATFRYPPASVDEMVDAADALMYRAKAEGGNRIAGAVVPGAALRWMDRALHPDDVYLVRPTVA